MCFCLVSLTATGKDKKEKKMELAATMLEHMLPMVPHTRPKGTGVLPRRPIPLLADGVVEETADGLHPSTILQATSASVLMHQQPTLGAKMESTSFSKKTQHLMPHCLDDVMQVGYLYVYCPYLYKVLCWF
jgi:hypothetical protein